MVIPQNGVKHLFNQHGFLVLYFLKLFLSNPPGLHFVNICTHLRVRDVSPEVSYVVSWSGEQVPSATCQIGFAGPVGDSLYSRSVCFDTISFLIKDCGVRVEFSEEGGSKASVCLPLLFNKKYSTKIFHPFGLVSTSMHFGVLRE